MLLEQIKNSTFVGNSIKMRRFLGILICALALNSCDDGDLILEDINFDDVDTQSCSTNDIIYKLKEKEALLLEIPKSVFVNEPTIPGNPTVIDIENSTNQVAYLGILDFNPGAVGFPLTVTGYRLGDKLTIDASALFALPGSQNITISAEFYLAPINLAATKVCTLTTSGGAPSGAKQLTWDDIVYGAPVVTVKPVTTGLIELYDGLTDKAQGNVLITITETGNGGSVITKTVPCKLAGHGMAITLTTTKIGWFDSGTITWSDQDIQVEAVEVPVN